MMKRLLLALSILLLSASPSFAHDYWLEPTSSGAKLVYGHQGEDESYDRSVLKEMKAFGKKGELLSGASVFSDGRHQINVAGAAGFYAKIDDGPWIKTIKGWQRGTKKKTSERVLTSSWDRYFAKCCVGSGPAIGMPLEIVIENVGADSVRGKVLFQGQPLPDATLSTGHQKVGKTDSKGSFVLKQDLGKLLTLRVSHKVKPESDDEVDWSRFVSTLSLQIPGK